MPRAVSAAPRGAGVCAACVDSARERCEAIEGAQNHVYAVVSAAVRFFFFFFSSGYRCCCREIRCWRPICYASSAMSLLPLFAAAYAGYFVFTSLRHSHTPPRLPAAVIAVILRHAFVA